jgi:hypothetical protein
VCGGKSNELIEPIVGDILVPLQRYHALRIEIADWDFLHVGRPENRGHQRDA